MLVSSSIACTYPGFIPRGFSERKGLNFRSSGSCTVHLHNRTPCSLYRAQELLELINSESRNLKFEVLRVSPATVLSQIAIGLTLTCSAMTDDMSKNTARSEASSTMTMRPTRAIRTVLRAWVLACPCRPLVRVGDRFDKQCP